jgi:hypothetical protein
MEKYQSERTDPNIDLDELPKISNRKDPNMEKYQSERTDPNMTKNIKPKGPQYGKISIRKDPNIG